MGTRTTDKHRPLRVRCAAYNWCSNTSRTWVLVFHRILI